jgi:hypothetical protein
VLSENPPPRQVVQAGYETRDLSPALVVTAALVLAIAGGVLYVGLWQWSQFEVPEQEVEGASPPEVMPGEPSVSARVESLPAPRLEPLEPLRSRPESYRSSRPGPHKLSPTQRPEDLRADRQPQLRGYGWVEKGKVARIPIDKAMDAVVADARAKAAKQPAKKGEAKGGKQ